MDGGRERKNCVFGGLSRMMRLPDLEGRWRVTREITDHRAGLTGQFTGEAVWSARNGGLIQTETGVMTYGTAPPMQATRRYLWQMQGADLVVLFEDGRPFHTVPAIDEEAVHDCPPDTYRVRYWFEGVDAFTTQWDVTGPRKDMRLVTTFARGPLK